MIRNKVLAPLAVILSSGRQSEQEQIDLRPHQRQVSHALWEILFVPQKVMSILPLLDRKTRDAWWSAEQGRKVYLYSSTNCVCHSSRRRERMGKAGLCVVHPVKAPVLTAQSRQNSLPLLIERGQIYP
jgi:hypothetical protein